MTRRGRPKELPIQGRVRLFLRLYHELKKEPYAQGGEIAISFSFGGKGDNIETNTHRQEFRSYLVLFRQLISPDDSAYLGTTLRLLPRYVHDAALRDRLAKATDAWKAAHGIPSPIAPLAMGNFASGRATAKLYLNGGVFHSDPDLSAVWDRIGPNQQWFVEYQFRQFEARVRDVLIEVKKVIDEARGAGVLKDEVVELNQAAV